MTTIDAPMDVTNQEQFLGTANSGSVKLLAFCFSVPFVVVLCWLLVPFSANSIWLFVLVWYPGFAAAYGASLWIVFQIYFPLPTRKMQFLITLTSMVIIMVGQIGVFYSLKGTIFLRGPVIGAHLVMVIVVLGFSYHWLTHYAASEDATKKEEASKGENENLLADSVTFSGRTILYSIKELLNSLVSTSPSWPLFPPSSYTNYKREYLAFMIPLIFLYCFEIWLVLFQIVIWESVVEEGYLIILVVVFSGTGAIARWIIVYAIQKLEVEPNFELPKSVLLVFLKEIYSLAFSRYLLWKGHGLVYFIYFLISAIEDLYRGILKLYSHKLPQIILFSCFREENTKESHEQILLHFALRKQAQLSISISFFFYNILIYTYYNKGHFGDAVTPANFVAVSYLLPITIVCDLLVGMATAYVARSYKVLELLQRFYAYPKVKGFVIVTTIAAMQLLFIAMLDLRFVSPH
eukprot:TRINITY_DN8393_c0_g1_i1.p1 TRINITY_DN8393_c0_g1~~TRINITY_DN8393_c0_g1_i1.p1  ORF type:complete len:463 (+),score=57.77 TRINITY_DN8393_c0_g1_i1:42-1430(+)